ncbi:MAG TPA: hypothetical protein VM736_01990 [Gemmatimonadales bacterium]|nr:hypothetical protein [Gemmatimonadales bacterium]
MTATELGTGATVVLARRTFWGPDLTVARRPGGQGRFALSLAGGDYERTLGVRLAVDAQFLVRPGERSGVGPYAGVGLAFVGAAATHGAAYLTASLGAETAPGRRDGWYGELGLGGGVRLSAGRRFRRFPPWW